MVHCGSIRQTASIVEMSADCLRTGDKASVKFRFVKQPEFLKEGQRLVFREGRTKAVGSVTKIIPHNPVGAKEKTEASNSTGNRQVKNDQQRSSNPRNAAPPHVSTVVAK